MQAASLKRLKHSLDHRGFVNISYLVVNHQANDSRRNYQQLKEKVEGQLPVYQQGTDQPDVWNLLRGEKDDFLIYDRCGQQTFHLGLPFTILSQVYVEEAIVQTYCHTMCTNCSLVEVPLECLARNATQPKVVGGHRGKHNPHRGHGHDSHKPTLRQRLPQNRTQIEDQEGRHQHPHHHHHQQHPHLDRAAKREEGDHLAVIEQGP